ncbi:hypothetical protein [Chryseobacterium indoltheticum]|jgi:hypothetical protein|uniref:hypothetical protein n=1 Tax=Chryseobacterium indoltheticum TaxID=254 RepID=UPI00242E1020|nr:hypothetical protein [Chryseobacterium indoltheticum]MDF2832150.1 hypothetical protein [Chryseobacterium indoltheticum]
MMNARVLELLKNPKNIQSEDLHLLKEEITSFPYIQNIRALHLYGIHLFDKENYQKELSTTAAYTTDKKILYHLINGKIQQTKIETVEKKPQIIENAAEKNKTQNTKEPFWWVKEKRTFPKHDYKVISENLITPKAEIKHVVVNGERNRILFEGEENYLEEKDSETIDLESTLESGVIVTQKSSFPIKRVAEEEKISDEKPSLEVSNEIIHEDKTDSEKTPESINDKSETNLLKTESFTPQADVVKDESVRDEIPAENTEKAVVAEVKKSEVIIHEEKLDSEKSSEKINNDSEVSFLEVAAFEPETAIIKEDFVGDKNSVENPDKQVVTEVEKSEVIIHEDKIDSEKTEEKINDESEVSFLEIESLKPETEAPTEESATENLHPEVIINEDKITTKDVAEKVNDESTLSFHGTDSFLPEVKIEANVSEQINPAKTQKSSINKHEDEMRRLIEEVEKRMKAHKKDAETKAKEPEEETGGEISFAETQDFVVSNENEPQAEEKIKTDQEIQEEDSKEKNETPVLEEVKEENSGWKPMSIESHVPDSFSKKIELSSEQDEKPEEVKEISEEPISEEQNQETFAENIQEETIDEVENKEPEITNSTEKVEAPVMNFSFFGTNISSLPIKKEEKENQPKEEAQEMPLKQGNQILLDSNVPGFINTWQSWLKIERTEEVDKAKVEIKNKVIESFIEKNPKISQLKDEVNFVVKEKTDDISHLMTETLANLYIEQKLYTKAINAFLVLAKKHPNKKEYFENKIQEIKDNRGKN